MTTYLRYLLLPFALVYGSVIWLRNLLYDNGVMKSADFDFPVISVGNLSYGGTGKTPHVEYLIRLLQDQYRVAVLSRGYGRKTHGYLIAETDASAEEVGDEPLLIKLKYPNTTVCLAEDRLMAIPQLLSEQQDLDVILMDDAMQHRTVTPGMSIMLTAYGNLYTDDYLIPMGTLREPRSAYRRADIIIVTKCPKSISKEEKARIRKAINPGKNQAVLFSYLEYGQPYSIMNAAQRLTLSKDKEALLFSGIAIPDYLEEHLKVKLKHLYSRRFRDHHKYDRYDMENITNAFGNIEATDKVLLTTEKDAVKLVPFKEWVVEKQLPIYIVPVRAEFFEEDKALFDSEVSGYMGRLRPALF